MLIRWWTAIFFFLKLFNHKEQQKLTFMEQINIIDKHNRNCVIALCKNLFIFHYL